MAKIDELSNINWAKSRKEIGQSSSSIEIKEDDWIISIMKERPNVSSSNKQYLPKVPAELRKKEQNKGFFDPTILSIGPYHHGKPEVEEAEKLKTNVARTFIAESNREPHEFYNNILKVVSDARKCYLPGSTDAYDDEAFAHMMFLDGCFILQYILATMQGRQDFFVEIRDHIGIAGWSAITVDIVLLENQLPFLVLQELINTKFAEDQGKLGEQLIENYIVMAYGNSIEMWRFREKTYKHEGEPPFHLLQLIRKRFLGSHHHHHHQTEEVIFSSEKLQDGPAGKDDQRCSLRTIFSCRSRSRGHEETKPKDPIKDIFSYSFRSATELKAKGIHFKPSSTSFLSDFTFTSHFGYGVLTLPQLIFGWGRKHLLLNMMAYELAPSEVTETKVCNYIYFMNSLINGADDVMELRTHNIIHNFYGTDEEVAKAFNSMATGYSYLSFQGPIKDVSDRIQEHYSSTMKTWTAQLLHDYFTSPWSVIAFLAATFALLLTALQTYFQISPHSSK
ncbi:UPF0481 protein At3g47200-like [Cornus florida]|uniref:UPF0481 protein At3g47200-like n=1 Tax=Cornus florida TaxID=4283 RepID=UPI00289D1F72|nr:UPF0481 protein At3g47200-like [Cornus florida]